MRLVAALATAPESASLAQLEGVSFLWKMWLQQYWEEGQADGTTQRHLRHDDSQCIRLMMKKRATAPNGKRSGRDYLSTARISMAALINGRPLSSAKVPAPIIAST